MLKRIITAVIGICIIVPVLCFSDTFAFPALMSLLAAIGIFEFLRCVKLLKNFTISVSSIAIVALFPIIARYVNRGRLFEILFALTFLILIILFINVIFDSKSVDIEKAGLTFTFCIYIGFSFASAVILRDYEDFGRYTYLMIFFGAWETDTFAYFCGILFGKHKLLPKISPKKTIEGSIGGIIFCIISFIIFGFVMKRINGITPNLPILISAGFITSIVSQTGDLIMSAVKRKFDLKDYGKLFPGHGGVLDRFDSVIAVAPFLLIISMLFSFFIE